MEEFVKKELAGRGSFSTFCRLSPPETPRRIEGNLFFVNDLSMIFKNYYFSQKKGLIVVMPGALFATRSNGRQAPLVRGKLFFINELSVNFKIITFFVKKT